MGILDFDASLYLPGMPATPLKSSFKVRLDANTYKAIRAVTFPEHKINKDVLPSPGGDENFTITAGSIDGNSEGSFKLLPASAKLFMLYLKAKFPVAPLHSIPFFLTAYAVDPATQVTTTTHGSLSCQITNIKDDDVGPDGNEPVGTVFSYKSLKETFNGIAING